MASVMREKLKKLKVKLKSWNWEVFGNMDHRVKKNWKKKLVLLMLRLKWRV